MDTSTRNLSSRSTSKKRYSERRDVERRGDRIKRHKVPTCPVTKLPRYRDRKQAKTVAAARACPSWDNRWVPFACPACRGFHLEKVSKRTYPAEAGELLSSLPGESRPDAARRYVLVDIENLTAGRVCPDSVAEAWASLRSSGPKLIAADHVVVGAGRYVVRHHASLIRGANVRWVVGAAGKDGADRALLAACNPFEVAKRFDELIIVSGDHAFVDLAHRARRLGVRIHVVTPNPLPGARDPLSRQLAAAANLTTTVPAPREAVKGPLTAA